jgi:type II secretory pathway component PulF
MNPNAFARRAPAANNIAATFEARGGVDHAATASPSAPRTRSRARPMLRNNDALMLISQLTIMSQAGVDIAEALRTVAAQTKKPAVKQVLTRVSAEVEGGLSLADALLRHRALDETIIASISAGEQAGALVTVLERVTQLLRNDMRLQSTVWSMLTYPLVLCCVTAMVISALIFFVLPQFAQVFRDIGKPPPPLTQVLLGIGEGVRNHLLLVLAGAGGVIAAGLCVYFTEAARQWFDRLVLHVYAVRRASRALFAGRTFRLLGTMLQTGIPLLDSIRLCRTAAGNLVFRRALELVERDVLQGKGLGGTLLTFEFLPDGAAQMISTAERTGKLGQVLQTVGEYYEDEGERALRDLIKVLEPAIIVGLGGLVAMVVLSVMLPLLDVSTMSH